MPGPRGPLRARAYRALLWLARHTGAIGNAFRYLAAGLLREDELQADSEVRWHAFGVSVDDADAGLGEDEREFYARFARPGDRILLVGSGGGRDLIALHALGHSVSGLEQVPALADLSRRRAASRGLGIPVETGALQTTDRNGSYDVVIFSPGCYSYVRGSAVRIAMLGRIGRHLSPAGRVVLSYHPIAGGRSVARALTSLTTQLSCAGWRPERGDVFSRDYMARDVLRFHHEFGVRDLAREYARAGFHIVADEPRGALRFAAAVPEAEGNAAASERIAVHTAGSAASDRR